MSRESPLSMQVEDCLIGASWRKAESEVLDTPEIHRLVNRATPYEYMNGIYRTRLASAEASKEIERLHRFFNENKISFRWYVFPHSSPSDLDRRLQQLEPARVTEMQGLFARTDDPAFQVPSGISVEELSSENLRDYTETNIAGWNQSGAEADKIRREIHEDFKKREMGYRAFLARYEGRPAATGLLKVVNGAGYFYGGSTNPAWRGRGAYRGLVAHRLKLLAGLGIPRAFVLARKDSSAPICRKLGFQIACESRCFSFSFE